MGRIYLVGWFHRETLAHCNTSNGIGLCRRAVRAHVDNGYNADQRRLGMTTKEALERGWKLCPRCAAKKNAPYVENADRTVEIFRKQVQDAGL
jgi:hypothetical protein